jgi:putative transposase
VTQEGYPAQLCCALLGLSRLGFYAWKKQPAKLISAQELKLYHTARDLFRKSRESFGSRELMKVLRKKHFNVGRAKTRSTCVS